jgi:hypothetical protein
MAQDLGAHYITVRDCPQGPAVVSVHEEFPLFALYGYRMPMLTALEKESRRQTVALHDEQVSTLHLLLAIPARRGPATTCALTSA